MIKAITCLNTILRNLPGFSAKEKPFCTLEQKGLYKMPFSHLSKLNASCELAPFQQR
ncbi:hypothetical protein GYO_3577 [Bacillus spizizenii TU-B-10]|uniref:Uncharacterized protein n=1 Tax=Bacillus spizizenii (strain DSM 15029 / JCM 12233 / NBRC 101239 / NRRL B-23049 / TU-B-10) TaxID=1052585 RepID=G4P0H4_BACS4|nr:hypothetical protein GYO_3577 [Bacillus spizizenii TU-B-10]SCV39044.1 hypothetical protein BQ1740_0774 [Bacillus subtilis]